MSVDLTQFCATVAEDNIRKYLHSPFSHDGFTYASDGAIMVRVPLIDGWPEATTLKPKLGEQINAIFKGFTDAQFISASATMVPADSETAQEVECNACGGTGHEHKCPDCSCTCDGCDGRGKELVIERVSTTFYGDVYRLKYIRLMLALPGIEVAPIADVKESKPLLFRFNEGEGVLLARRERCKRHVEMAVAA